MYDVCMYLCMYMYVYYSAILPPPPANRGPLSRPVPPKSKVFSILDRARAAMDQNFR